MIALLPSLPATHRRLTQPLPTPLPSCPLAPGWSIAGSLWYGINTLFPPPGLGEVDDEDIFDTFGEDDSSINSVPDEEKKGDAPAADAVLAHPVEEPSLTYQRA